MSKFPNKYHQMTRQSTCNSEHKNILARASNGTKNMPLTFYGRKNAYFSKENLNIKHNHLTKHKINQTSRLSLASINGLNLLEPKND